MKKLTTALITAGLLAGAGSAHAQTWDAPSFLGPRPDSDLGVYIVDGDFGDIGIQGIWRSDATNLGVRLGFIDAPDDVLQVGVETWGPIRWADAEFPLDVSWTAGAGASVNGRTTVSVPAGVSIGRVFEVGSIAVQAYGHPRLMLVAFEDPNDDLELDLDGQFDIGADLYLSEGLTVRLGASLGDPDALGFGLAWRR